MICDAALIDRTVGRRGADHPQRRAPRQASAAASGAVGGDSQAVGIAAALSRADFLHGTDSAIYPGQAPPVRAAAGTEIRAISESFLHVRPNAKSC